MACSANAMVTVVIRIFAFGSFFLERALAKPVALR
jgi:hypothetical protein